jgi:hypothetical protein
VKIYGLTLTQPWALGFNLGKAVENRGWVPAPGLGRFLIALHGGRKPVGKARDDALLDLELILSRQPQTQEQWALLQKARTLQDRRGSEYLLDAAMRHGIFGVAEYAGFEITKADCQPAQQQWYAGPYAWQLEKVVLFKEPIACKGAQKLWQPSEEVEREIRKRLEESHVST